LSARFQVTQRHATSSRFSAFEKFVCKNKVAVRHAQVRLHSPKHTQSSSARLERVEEQCRFIGPLGLPGWVVAEAADERSLKAFRNGLVFRQAVKMDFDLSSIDYAILVGTKDDR
jgi:hypothetical protein